MSRSFSPRGSGLTRGILLKVLYPLLMLVGAMVSTGRKEALQNMVIRRNNRLVLREGHRGNRLLLLLPHCLQVNECKIRLTYDVRNCKGCGKCEIKDLIEIADENNLDLHVATGGNLARRIVQDIRPHAIIAVACERDLSSGIADTWPMPVLGIPNERPCGPCVNTRVDLSEVGKAIRLLSPSGR
jgi:hypothetical protein